MAEGLDILQGLVRAAIHRSALRFGVGLATFLLWATCAHATSSTAPAKPAHEKVVIAAEDGWYPYGGAMNGKAVGLGVDLVRASFAAVGIEVEFKSVPYARCLSMAVEGTVLACNEPARTAETEKLLLWPDKPLFTARSLIYARRPSSESGLTVKSLEGKRVLVTHGFEYGSEFDANTRIQKVPAVQEISLFRMLLVGRGDYLAAYEKVADHIIANHPKAFRDRFVAVGTIAETSMYCAFSPKFPGSQRYLQLFNEGYALLAKRGELKAIEDRWR